jgi:transposase-like protein
MPREWLPPNLDDLVEHYLSGQSVKALAEQHGVSRNVIDRVLDQAGVQRRGRSEAMTVRMAQTSPEERARLAEAAHNAVRGKRQSVEHRARIAATRERLAVSSPYELLLAEWLVDMSPVTQKAIGVYNVDLAIEPVAVEVFGGNWHGHGRHRGRFQQRRQDILDGGWSLLVVWVTRQHRLQRAVADEVRAFVDLARREPSLVGQYRVVWGDGQLAPTCCDDPEHLALVPAASRADCRRS